MEAKNVGVTLKNLPAEATWELRREVLWPNKPLAYVQLPEDDQGLHFGIQLGERVVSVISLFIQGEEAQFRKFATLPSEQGKGYGSHLLTHIIGEAGRLGVRRIWCNARVETANFYKRFGILETEHRFHKGAIPYVIMEKWLDQ